MQKKVLIKEPHRLLGRLKKISEKKDPFEGGIEAREVSLFSFKPLRNEKK